MFLRRIALVFIVTHFQSLNKFVTSVTGHNHLINQTTFCRTIGLENLSSYSLMISAFSSGADLR